VLLSPKKRKSPPFSVQIYLASVSPGLASLKFPQNRIPPSSDYGVLYEVCTVVSMQRPTPASIREYFHGRTRHPPDCEKPTYSYSNSSPSSSPSLALENFKFCWTVRLRGRFFAFPPGGSSGFFHLIGGIENGPSNLPSIVRSRVHTPDYSVLFAEFDTLVFAFGQILCIRLVNIRRILL